jgi:uncharacterized caspase-like protein/Tfp pilus assembly protein PilF
MPHVALQHIFRAAAAAVLVALLAAPAGAQVGKPEGLYYKSWAVIIGINDYAVAPKLDWAVPDGKATAEALRKVGFDEVVEMYDKDASYKRLLAVLNDYLPRKVGRMDRVVIFFAGHGGTTTDNAGKPLGYLVPWDAQPANANKAVTFDHLKDFSRRVMAKHVLFLMDAAVAGWDVTPPQQLSLEGRLSPEEETEKRAIQVLTAGDKGDTLAHQGGRSLFGRLVVDGLSGAGDVDKNGWLMASELVEYVTREIAQRTKDGQHPQFAQLDGEGDTVLIEGKKSDYRIRRELKTPGDRRAAAKEEYEQAFSLLQQQRPPQEAVERLNRALQYDPSYGDAYVLKSYLYMEFLPNLDEALAAAKLGVEHAPTNPDAPYTLGLILQRKGQFKEAEAALRQALTVNPNYTDVYLSLGDLYAQDLKDKARAVDAYQRYMETGGNENRVRQYLSEAGSGGPNVKQ